MARRIGIASDLEVRKFELQQEFKNTRDWASTDPFVQKQEALDWADAKSKELSCKQVKPSKAGKGPQARWFGFSFVHDGPK